jgi:uncharacterized membrane protein required for colicin V production
MRRLLSDDTASIVPVLLFILAIVGVGALYTLLFTEVALPIFSSYIPDSDSKTFIFMIIYALPLIILLVGVFALLKEGLKRTMYGGY